MTFSLASLEKVLGYRNMFLQGLAVTILLSAVTVLFGFILAFVLALMHLSSLKILRIISGMYVQFVRCTPMLVQVFLVYYIVFGAMFSLPKFTFFGFIQFERFFPAAFALALNSGGYMSDVIRGGIEGVDAGQTEAARSLGMSKSQTLWHIVLPQAIKNILPAVANEFVTIIKESSVCYTIGVQDIMFNVKSVQSASFIIAEPLLVATFLYFCLCYPTSKIIQHVERRMRTSDKR